MKTKARILRSNREIGLMRQAGLLVWQAHQAAARLIQPGVTTRELDAAIQAVFQQAGAEPLFLGYPGETPFPAVSCISVNEQLVHGIPGDRKLREGDIVSLDTGCRIRGWCGDAAVTHAVGSISEEARQLLGVTLGALNLAIDEMTASKKWSEIARKMQQYVESGPFSVITSMVGHGIGKEMHEPPQVPNYYGSDWVDACDFDLKPGVVLAIEPMVSSGSPHLKHLSDHWTAISKDRSLTAHFEHTVAFTSNGPRRLTGPPETEDELAALPEWLRDENQWALW